MAEARAVPSVDDKINALTDAVTTLMRKVDGMVSRDAMSRKDSAAADDDRGDKAAKDAARDTLFGKRDKADEFPPKKEEGEEEEKEAKGDEDEEEEKKGDEFPPKKEEEGEEKEEEEEEKEKKGDEAEEEKGEPAPMASDDKSDRADARADAAIRSLKKELADLRRSIRRPRTMTDDELNNLAERQQEWDRVAQMHGQRASRPLDGERIESYDRRLSKMFQKHSPRWKDHDLTQMPIEVVTKVVAPDIRADAITAAYRVEPSEGAMLREVRKADRTGRIISEFVGPVNALNGALAPFRMPSARVRRINTQPNQF
jgi:hypothetical protein